MERLVELDSARWSKWCSSFTDIAHLRGVGDVIDPSRSAFLPIWARRMNPLAILFRSIDLESSQMIRMEAKLPVSMTSTPWTMPCCISSLVMSPETKVPTRPIIRRMAPLMPAIKTPGMRRSSTATRMMPSTTARRSHQSAMPARAGADQDGDRYHRTSGEEAGPREEHLHEQADQEDDDQDDPHRPAHQELDQVLRPRLVVDPYRGTAHETLQLGLVIDHASDQSIPGGILGLECQKSII